jgi:hypothetical protein
MLTNSRFTFPIATALLAVSIYSTPVAAADADQCVLDDATVAAAKAGISDTLAAYNTALNGGKTLAEGNQELFIFEKDDDGKWRIARYSFSPTNPPRK